MINDGGSAFPTEQHECQDNTWNQTYEPGMTLRDYFAGQVLPAVYEECTETSPGNECETWSQMVAREAFDIADAMISVRATAALAAKS